LKSLLKRVLYGLGLEVRLRRNVEAHARREWEDKWCERWRPFVAHRPIRTILDIGANAGQFARLAHRLCPQARILSFEPLPDCFVELQRNLEVIPGARAFNVALGDHAGMVTMNRSAFTPCSSLLAGTADLGRDIPAAAAVSQVSVPLLRLDDILADAGVDDELLIKMDVQGFEPQVIRGGPAAFRRASIVATEVCFCRPLYQGQPLFDDLYGTLRGLGFAFMGNAEQQASLTDARVVEADAIFERAR
jgi:FkbM family methyltransferase